MERISRENYLSILKNFKDQQIINEKEGPAEDTKKISEEFSVKKFIILFFSTLLMLNLF